jgi:hypothetical protein
VLRLFVFARWLVRLEIGIWRSLFLLVTRRVSGRGPGVQEFSYSRQISPIIGAFIFVSLIELPVVHLLIPWDMVRLVVLVISVWGLLWMVGFLASMKVFPHLLDGDGLRIRYGTSVDVAIRWSAVASVTARRGSIASRKNVHVESGGGDGTVASFPVMKQTRVDVALERPTCVALPEGTEEITAVRLYADDARAFVAAARERLEAASRTGAR